MKKSGLIVNAGSINMDLIVRSPKIPEPGETIIGNGFQTAVIIAFISRTHNLITQRH